MMEASLIRSDTTLKKKEETSPNDTGAPFVICDTRTLTSASIMPQESASQNSANEDAATLPLPVPNFTIPAHLMGRNVENPTEDIVSHGRKPQKPRLGVKVPCRNLTSQIVTQDELAQELLERSLKKYPNREPPEGGDIFFAIKLTQRLANRLAPSASNLSSSTTMQPVSNNTTNMHAHQQKNNLLSENNFSVHEPKVIADDKELLAILEGDVDPNWIPEKSNPSPSNYYKPDEMKTPIKENHFVCAPKLDPVLEKELALKQLMEFETSPREKKTDNSGEKNSRKAKPKVKNITNESNALSENNAQKQGMKQANNANNNVDAKKKLNQKRKAPSDKGDVANKKRKSNKKSTSENVENGKTDKTKANKLQKDKKSVIVSDKEVSKNVINVIESVVNFSAVNSVVSDLQSKKVEEPVKEVSFPRNVADNMLTDSNKSHTVSEAENEGGKENVNINNSTVCLLDSNVECTSSVIKKTTPLKTYSPKKKSDNDNVDSCAAVMPGSSGIDQKLSDVPASVKKRVRRSELDKLLIDEGAINLLYEAELSESNRRTAVSDTDLSLSSFQKRTSKPKLNSSRRKKKDLLLKTRLVKNAVLRLKTMQNPSINLRTKRQFVPITEKGSSNTEGKMAPPRNCVTFESIEQTQSSAPIAVGDSSNSRQSFTYPPRLPLRAEASRIIRRHSSSSNFSSRSTSPIIVHRTVSDGKIVPSKLECNTRTQTDKKHLTEMCVEKSTVKRNVEARKKGVPIFVRKVDAAQTYKGKKRQDGDLNHNNASMDSRIVSPTSVLNKASKSLDTKISNTKSTNSKSKFGILAADDGEKRNVVLSNSHKKTTVDRAKQKIEVIKQSQKSSLKEKVIGKVAKLVVENGTVVTKKKLDSRDRLQKLESATTASFGEKGTMDTRTLQTDADFELTTCLAEAASAFAAEDRALRESSPTATDSGDVTHSVIQKKDVSRLHPQSPNAASYSNLVKTLEMDNQKHRRKEGEEYTKPRTSFRQSAGTFSYREISLRRYDGLVQIIMNPASTKMKNSLNLQVLRELRDALIQMKRDESCRAVLLTSTGNLFCQGIDLHCLLYSNADRRKAAAQEFALAVKDFIRTLAQFSKPLIAGVNGAAVGLGVTMLPFFDMIIASDKATFYTPYSKLGQVPEGGATLTLQHMFGNSLTSELLFGSRRITANEAFNFGLVTRILWPDRFQEELIPIVRAVSAQSSQSMEATKALLRHSLRTKLDAALESETQLLIQHWMSNECQTNVRRFLDSDEDISLQRQRIDPDL